MNVKNMIKKLIYKQRYDSDTYIKYLRSKGVTIGENCRIFNPKSISIDLQNPYLITIGDNVRITKGVIILTHDYSWSVLATLNHEILGSINTVEIGNNCFIGMNTIILKNTKIGDNVIIGAGSVVTGKIESNSVYAGNPARKIMSIEEFYAKRKERQSQEITKITEKYEERTHKKINEKVLREYFWNFKNRKETLTKEQIQLVKNIGCEEDIMKNYQQTEPIIKINENN